MNVKKPQPHILKFFNVFSALFLVVLFFGLASDAHASIIIQRPLYIGLTDGLVGFWSFDGQGWRI